jgi:hypothetical protein
MFQLFSSWSERWTFARVLISQTFIREEVKPIVTAEMEGTVTWLPMIRLMYG